MRKFYWLVSCVTVSYLLVDGLIMCLLINLKYLFSLSVFTIILTFFIVQLGVSLAISSFAIARLMEKKKGEEENGR